MLGWVSALESGRDGPARQPPRRLQVSRGVAGYRSFGQDNDLRAVGGGFANPSFEDLAVARGMLSRQTLL